jgi:phenylalanyl-tRNA synthetase beta chain
MPTLNVGYNDLCKLIGKEMPIELLEEKLFLMKCEVENVSGDEMLLEVTSDRPDLLCSEGIARELRGLLDAETGLINYKTAPGDMRVNVDQSIKRIRPYIAGAIVRNLRLTDDSVRQIMQLQEKLHLTYCRNRTKVSVGVHDADKVTHKLTYVGIAPGKIRFRPLGEEREMNGSQILESTPKGREYGWIIKDFPEYPLLYDSNGNILSLPPIINGVVTQVTPGTTNLLMDVTGTDLKLVNFVNNIIVSTLAERGGVVESAKVMYGNREIRTPDLKPSTASLNLSSANDMLGLTLKISDVVALLKRMRYGVKSTSKRGVTVLVPPYRADIMHEADLVEDLAIAYGYNKLQPTMPFTATIGSERGITKLSRKIRDLMVGLGFIEVLNYVMTSTQLISGKMGTLSDGVVEVANPLSSDFAVLRNWLLPGLLSFLSCNKHVPYPQKIFECGDVVSVSDAVPTKSVTKKRVGAVTCDYKTSYEDIQASLYSLLRNAGSDDWQPQRIEHPSFIKGRVAAITISGKEVAFLGEIHPQLLESFEIENPVTAFELDLEAAFKIVDSNADYVTSMRQ